MFFYIIEILIDFLISNFNLDNVFLCFKLFGSFKNIGYIDFLYFFNKV